MVTIVDYGVGNPLSVQNMIKRAGGKAEITAELDKIADAKALIIPGVGHFGRAMEALHRLGMVEVLNQKALVEKVPVLGICLGMQLLLDHSEEGDAKGLGWIAGEVIRFSGDHHKVPHMGWEEINISKANPLIVAGETNPRFYFVHSYYAKAKHKEDVLATAQYEGEFHCAISHGNIYGTQFHPEKSHKFGLSIMGNFLKICNGV